jgi:hypothetical protein
MRYLSGLCCLFALHALPSVAAERDSTVFQPFLNESSAECVPVDAVKKLGAAAPLSQEQFRFAQAMYAAIPPMSKTLPPGDSAVLVGASDGTAILLFVDGDRSCARFLAPNFVLQMLNDIKAGKIEHAGDPT